MLLRRMLAPVLWAVGLSMLLGLALQASSHAQSPPCYPTYTVRDGDTLAQIAQILDVSPADLRAANPTTIPEQGSLYAGQVLCLPEGTISLYVDGGPPMPAAEASSDAWISPRLAIEVTYQFTPTTADDEQKWNLVTSRGGFVGKRLIAPLQPYNAFKAVTQPERFQAALRRQPAPVLLAVRNSDLSPTYTLVFIGDQAPPIASLLITGSVPIHLEPNVRNGAPVEQVLGGPRIADVDLRVWLESPAHMRWPMKISHISYMQDARTASSFYKDAVIVMALVPTTSSEATSLAGAQRYQALVLLQHNRYGPAGAVMAANCEQWQGKRGVIYGLLRALSRCPH